ncbi:MAG: hypothetical protein AB1650_02500, partial [Candidatus Omnitrophota bacterium]
SNRKESGIFMDEEVLKTIRNRELEEKKALEEIYKKRGYQQQHLTDYLNFKRQEAKRKNKKIPVYLKVLSNTPFILLFCVGIVFIPYMIFLFIQAFFE